MSAWVLAGLWAGAALADPRTALPAATVAQMELVELQEQRDRLLQSGFDRPDAALAALSNLARSQPPQVQSMLLLARGLILANAGRTALAESVANSLAASSDALAMADSLLVKAALAQTQGQPSV
ncbi:MAG TPA: hypothetical protein VK570_18750, partial [Rubrivivax sp.]|nr:hypothetical protein [Rubrivivax sp.]